MNKKIAKVIFKEKRTDQTGNIEPGTGEDKYLE